MGVTINVNGISLVHKDSGGVATATMPDVCKTQMGSSVVPVPYPNIAVSSDLAKGTKTVKVDGGNSAAIDGSEFSKSTGDEPGSIGGVSSGVNTNKATWISSSFDVTIEGKGACRLSDKMFMNNSNTTCMAGIFNPPVAGSTETKLTGIAAEIIKVTFDSKIKVAVGNAKVDAPHWEKGKEPKYDQEGYGVSDKNKYGACAKKPAVYSLKDKDSGYYLDVKINVTKLENISGTGILTGNIKGLEMEGKSASPLSLGSNNEFRVKIKNPPDAIMWYKGKIQWQLKVEGNDGIKGLKGTIAEVFFILDKPGKMFDKNGVWAEALRFLCNKVKVTNIKEDAAVTKRITSYCHGKKRHGLKYDSYGGGGSNYGVREWGGGEFLLRKYLAREDEFANCYDQAAAVQTLAGAVGVEIKWIFMQPFGYIRTTNLLGYGQCNNPFFLYTRDGRKVTPQIIDINDVDRTGFGNHAFCELNDCYYDACAGPHLGDSESEYLKKSIDYKTTLYKAKYRRMLISSGKTMNKSFKGVTGVSVDKR